MKDFFISSSDKIKIKDENNTTLPALIRLNQFKRDFSKKNENSNELKNVTTNILKFTNTNTGYMGSGYYDFGFIINHKYTANIKWLYTRVYNYLGTEQKREILINRKDITDRFMILEIPDYGAQATSPFFTDFVPHIYINGLKLWQRYFCILKHYSKKIAYILIDRDVNNLNYTQVLDSDGKRIESNCKDNLIGKKIDIRICFKNNIEQTYSSLFDDAHNENSIVLKLDRSSDGKKFTGAITSKFFNFGSFESMKENLFSINDFDFIAIGETHTVDAVKRTISSESVNHLIHQSFIKHLEFKKEERENKIITKDIARNTNNDYFKQIYSKDLNKDSFVYERPDARATVTLVLKESLKHNICGNIRCIVLLSKSNLEDAIYSDEENFNFDIRKFDLDYNGNNYSKFDKNGYYDGTTSGFEYIPEYTSTRKMTFTGTDIKKAKIKNSYPNLYRWNLENAFEFGYDSYGKLLKKEDSNFSTYFIYDSGEDESNDTITASGSVNEVSFSTDNINIESEIIRENNNYQFTYSSNNKKLTFTEDKLPLSFYIKFGSPNAAYNTNLKIYAINRCFVIPYEVMIIDNYTLLCKINDYFIHNDKLNFTNYNTFLNKNFLNGFEPVLFTNGIKNGPSTYYGNETSEDEDFDFHLYNVDGYNNYLRDNTGYYNYIDEERDSEISKLVNNNIVNFSSRSVEI